MPFQTFFNLPEEKRQKIIECAIEEFSQQDYSSASVSKIVLEVGIAKGSLYQYFKDKSDLYAYLLDKISQTKSRMMAEAFLPQDEFPFFDRLRALFSVMAKFELQYPKLARLGYKATSGKSPLPDELVLKGKQATIHYFMDLIEEGKKKGEIRTEINAEISAFIFVSALSEIGHFVSEKMGEAPAENQAYSPRQLEEMEHLYQEIVTTLQFGMSGKPTV